MYQLILIVHVLAAIGIIGLVLIQHGKGADIGAAFGSGASNTVFGSQGTGSFLFRLTSGLVLTFFTTSVLLSTIVAGQYKKTSQPFINQTLPVVQEGKIPLPVQKDKK